MNWLKNRLKERTTLDGAILVVVGGVILLAGPFAKIAAYAAIVYGIGTMWKAQ